MRGVCPLLDDLEDLSYRGNHLLIGDMRQGAKSYERFTRMSCWNLMTVQLSTNCFVLSSKEIPRRMAQDMWKWYVDDLYWKRLSIIVT